MLGPKSLQTAPFLRKVWILMPNWVPPGGVDEVLFSILGEPFFLLGPSWPSDPPQRALWPAFGPILRCLPPQTLPEELRGVLLERFWGVSSTNKPNNQWTNQPINKSTKQPINQSTNLQNNHSTNHDLASRHGGGKAEGEWRYIYIYVYTFILLYSL